MCAVWVVREQVFVAALDCGESTLAQSILGSLQKMFPQSTRVAKLEGMQMEALGMYDDALKLYNDILQKEPTCAEIWRRKVAVLKAQRDVDEAIKEMNEYLKVFMCDHEAWLELSELQISMQNYADAAYCLEEVLLSNPHNHLYHQRYAEIHYTLGGPESYTLACKHYAKAIKLNPRNIRALYGYHISLCAVISSTKGSKVLKEKKEVLEWVSAQIKKVYSEYCSEDRVQLVEETLKRLEPSQRQ